MIAVLVYGQFRSFKLNLLNNLHELFDEVSSDIHFYFLTENCQEYQDYEKNKAEVFRIINEYKNPKNIMCEVKYFEHLDSSIYYSSVIEQQICEDYNNIQTPYKKDVFTPKLIYRRCLINEIMNRETGNSQIKYDKVIFARLFDAIFKRCKSLEFINDVNDNKIYFGVDTLFLGKQDDMNILMKVDYIRNKIIINNVYEFHIFYIKHDECLGKMLPMCASETIFSAVIFNHFLDRCQNLRFDYSRDGISSEVYKVDDEYDGYGIANNGVRINTENYVVIILDPKRKVAKYCL